MRLICFQRSFKLYSASDAFNHEAIPVIRVVTVAILIMSQGSIWLNAILGTGLTRINLAIEFVTVGSMCSILIR
ncbi:MAG: hypothetical protein IPF93_24730 [Saprospiraceae bacterium]|nr:hypothetical protein [Saprospiraceae bacterium]